MDGNLLAELNAAGAVLTEYVYLEGAPLAMVTNGQFSYIHPDHLGTPERLTDASGRVVWSASYDPFGRAAVQNDPDGNGQALTLNLRFPGQYFDQETGLHYNYFRDYDPATGRYLTSDPIRLDGGLNTYLYAKANPLRYVDPDGLNPAAACALNPGLCVETIIKGCKVIRVILQGVVIAVGLSNCGGTQCEEEECPPCITVSGRIVPVGTIGYRPLDTPPPGKTEHGISGPHPA